MPRQPDSGKPPLVDVVPAGIYDCALQVATAAGRKEHMLDIRIRATTFQALLDTGSSISLLGQQAMVTAKATGASHKREIRSSVKNETIQRTMDLQQGVIDVFSSMQESVRKASESSLRALTKACVRTCDAQAKGREHALGVIIPSVAKGLSSSVAEARHTSLDTLVQLSRSAGPALRPHLALLFGALLDALSELESPVLNQLSVRADADARDRLDAARVAASRTSPAMETINYCVQFVDASVLPELVPRLVEQSKSAVGLGTKAGCCHLATTLAHQCPLDLEPFTGKLLRAFVRGLSDRNATVRRCCATAVGHLSKVAKESDVDRLFTKLQMWYMEGGWWVHLLYSFLTVGVPTAVCC
ncbi:hypothetical protein MRX96_008165 [Rhipicephalus microplus]